MAQNKELHRRLVALQSDEELERKWQKAQGRWSKRNWAREGLDVANREAERLTNYFKEAADRKAE